MKKEKINRYGRSVIIGILLFMVVCFGIGIAFFMLRKVYIDFVLVSIVGFLFGADCIFILILGRKLKINYDKQEIKFWEILGVECVGIGIPLYRKIQLKEISNISNKDNEICFTLLSGKTISCIVRQNFSSARSSEKDKKIAADLVEKLMTYFFTNADGKK